MAAVTKKFRSKVKGCISRIEHYQILFCEAKFANASGWTEGMSSFTQNTPFYVVGLTI